ncbi:MAG TPA: TlpA disulfide reductase family protein [Gammaproteobacteria bacterium]|nr:TlpA disulfide reductase family protein [Gammaproteobacteria bacterium]
MIQHKYTALVIVLLIAAGAAGYEVYSWLSPGHDAQDTAAIHVGAGIEVVTKPEVPMTPADAIDTRMAGLAGGSAHTLADFHGKVVLVNFWATWCGPCREEIPELVHLQAKYGGAGLQVVGVATDEPETAPVQDYLKNLAVLNYPMIMGTEQVGRLVAGLGGNLVGLPYTILLDRNGRPFKIHAGELHAEDADKLIQEALAVPETPAGGGPGAISPARAPKSLK